MRFVVRSLWLPRNTNVGDITVLLHRLEDVWRRVVVVDEHLSAVLADVSAPWLATKDVGYVIPPVVGAPETSSVDVAHASSRPIAAHASPIQLPFPSPLNDPSGWLSQVSRIVPPMSGIANASSSSPHLASRSSISPS